MIMATKIKNETSRKTRGSRVKSEKVSSNELQTVVNSVSAPALGGSGLSDGVTGVSCSSAPVGVGSSSASSGRAARMDLRAKLENSLRFEGFSLSCGVRDFSAKLGGFFAAPEWSEKEDTENKIRATFPDWSDEMVNAAVNAAAKKAGLDLSAPSVSAARVLAVVRREGLIPEFVSLVGMSFAKIREHIAVHGLNNYNWRLGVGAIRSNSDINDFVDVVPVASGASASAIIGALLSLSNFVDFGKRLSAAKSSDRSDYNQFVGLAVRLGKRLGYDIDRVINDIRYDFNTCASSDYKQRAQLRKNLDSATNTINECNDLILSLGGVTVLDDNAITAKVARTIKTALKRRGCAYSVASTIEKLLDM